MTRAPRAANSRAWARPIPRPAPVTSATRPSKRRTSVGILVTLCDQWHEHFHHATLLDRSDRGGLVELQEALTTTRAVRKRLDLERPVDRAVVEECLRLAFQAPNGSNGQLWAWVLVDDPDLRQGMA